MTSPEATPRTHFRSFLAGGALVLVGIAVIFRRVLFAGELFVGRDTLLVYYPVAKFWADRVRAWDFPEWYPYDALGQPFIGMVISGALHPSKLLYLVFPLGTAHSLNTLLCYPLAVGGVWLCARSLGVSQAAALFAGITYGLSGYLVDISNNWLYLMSAATFPWALWATYRFFQRPGALRLLVAALLHVSILFAGDPQSFAITGAAMVLLALAPLDALPRKRRLLQVSALLLCSALLSLPQLLPALHTRSIALEAHASLETAQVYSLHPARLLELVLGPIFFDASTGYVHGEIATAMEPRMRGLWVGSVGVGALAFGLAVFALIIRRRNPLTWWFAALALLTLLMALGRYAPVYGWVFHAIPPWQGFRFPEKLLPFALFLLSLGAAVGLSEFLQHRERPGRPLQWILVGTAIILGLVALSAPAIGQGLVSSVGAGTARVDIENQFAHLAWIAAASLMVAAVSLRLPSPSQVAAFCTIQAAVLALMHAPLPKTSAVEVLDAPSPFIAAIRAETKETGLGGARVLSAVERWDRQPAEGLDAVDLATAYQVASLRPSTPALFGIESSNYYLPTPSARVFRAYREDYVWLRRLAWLYGTGYVAVDQALIERAPVPEDQVVSVLPALGVGLLRRTDERPRAYLARARCVPDAEAAFQAVTKGPPIALGEAFIEGCDADETAPSANVALGRITHAGFAPESVHIAVTIEHPSVLVLNDALYEGWTATVGGEATPIRPANYAVRGVELQPGDQEVTFSYRAPYFRTGLVIALGTLVTLLLLVWRERRTTSASGTAPTAA